MIRYVWFVTVVLAATVGASDCYAQKGTAALEREYSMDGNKPYYVKKQSLDFDDSKDRNIGNFDNWDAAVAASNRLNAALKGAEAGTTFVRFRPAANRQRS
jgi:hypothetical protein